MSMLRFSIRNIVGNPFRSGVIFLCVMLVTGSGMWTSFIIQGVRENLRLSLTRMESPGVDLLVVPRGIGYASIGMDNVNLPDLLEELAAIPGVSQASPQMHVLTAQGSPYCTEGELFVIAFDPETDFTVSPWLTHNVEIRLKTHETIAGSMVTIPDGTNHLLLAGYKLNVLAQLESTGTNMDQSIFVTFETAREIFQQPQNDDSLHVDTSSIPAILVMLQPGSDPHQVGAGILKNIRGISIVDNTDLGSRQLSDILQGVPALLGMTWGLSILFIGMVFAIAVNERQREIGVLRALGSTRTSLFRSLLLEGFLLAMSGGLAGSAVSIFVNVFFRQQLVRTLGLPLIPSAPATLFVLAMVSLGMTFLSVSLAVLIPAWRISRLDLVIALRG